MPDSMKSLTRAVDQLGNEMKRLTWAIKTLVDNFEEMERKKEEQARLHREAIDHAMSLGSEYSQLDSTEPEEETQSATG